MKADRKNTPPVFKPVTLLLESQAEVDAIFSFLNHTDLVSAVDLPEDAFESLEPFRNEENCNKLHSALCDVVR
jgi:hypothetical protein